MTRSIVAALAGAVIAGLIAGPAGPAGAAGNLASKPTELPPLKMSGKDLSFSVKDYTVETGKYYKWHIEGDGVEEFTLQAPELFRNSWINIMSVDWKGCPKERCDVEMQPFGAMYGIGFDEPGAIDIWFVPIRPGEYEFYARGYQAQGMTGKFHVR